MNNFKGISRTQVLIYAKFVDLTDIEYRHTPMKRIHIKDFVKGWLIGNFEPTLLKTEDIEVALQSYNAGEEEPQHYHKVGTEISLLISGSAMFNNDVLEAGEGVVIEPKRSNTFKAITDCKVLVIKYPSNTKDKYHGEFYD